MIATVCRWSSGAALAVALVTAALLTTLASPPVGPAAGEPPLQLAAAPARTPGAVTIGTVPTVPNFPVTLDGVTRRTDPAGIVSFDAAAVSDHPLNERITLNEAVVSIDGRDVKATASRLYRSGSQHLLALDLSYRVSFGFTAPSGAPIHVTSPIQITVKSPTGQVTHLSADRAEWLQGSRVVNTGTGPEADQLEWTVRQVTYRGSNVVNTSQQKFRPAEQNSVDVELLFFSLSLQVRDALFRHPEGAAIDLVYPDGHSERLGIGEGGRVSIPALPRGHYTVSVVGPGPQRSQPLAVSRDQDLQLSFYSWWDLATVVLALLTVLAGLAVVGARRRRRAGDAAGPGAPTSRRAGRSPLEYGHPWARRTQRPAGGETGPGMAVVGDRRTE